MGDDTILYLERRNKEIFETIIDTKELKKLKDLDYCWHVLFDEKLQQYYVVSTYYYYNELGKKKHKSIYLHKIIMNIEGNDLYIDHKDNNTLNNRIQNLRVTLQLYNTKNRNGKNSNNKSGYRNVCWIKEKNKWCVQLQIDGKNTIVGKFDDVHEAGKYAKIMREKYYKDFAGKS